MIIMRSLLGQDQGRLWPTGDVAWCHSADAVTADTPHSDTELLVLVPRDLLVSVATTGVPVCHLPSVQHDSGLFCLWTREKAGLRPAQSPNSHWMMSWPPISLQYLTTPSGIWCAQQMKMGQHMRNVRGAFGGVSPITTSLYLYFLKKIFFNNFHKSGRIKELKLKINNKKIKPIINLESCYPFHCGL